MLDIIVERSLMLPSISFGGLICDSEKNSVDFLTKCSCLQAWLMLKALTLRKDVFKIFSSGKKAPKKSGSQRL